MFDIKLLFSRVQDLHAQEFNRAILRQKDYL